MGTSRWKSKSLSRPVVRNTAQTESEGPAITILTSRSTTSLRRRKSCDRFELLDVGHGGDVHHHVSGVLGLLDPVVQV